MREVHHVAQFMGTCLNKCRLPFSLYVLRGGVHSGHAAMFDIEQLPCCIGGKRSCPNANDEMSSTALTAAVTVDLARIVSEGRVRGVILDAFRVLEFELDAGRCIEQSQFGCRKLQARKGGGDGMDFDAYYAHSCRPMSKAAVRLATPTSWLVALKALHL